MIRKNYLLAVLMFLLCIVSTYTRAQLIDTLNYNSGIWQYLTDPISKQVVPEIHGRLAKYRWADIEPAPNIWNWTNLDSDLTARAADSLPIIFMIYTKEDAPDWIFNNGVPKVIETDDFGNVTGYAPYYADSIYKRLFEAMITAVSLHVRTLPDNVKKLIIAVQGCYGSTGDYISYKGNVDPKYKLSGDDFFSLFKEFSQYYYDQYKQTNPSIRLLSNPPNTGDDQYAWVIQNCSGSWLKNGTIGKGYQLNGELSKSAWLYNIMNTPQAGRYVRTRCEINGNGLLSNWWYEYRYRNMLALLCYGIYWGLDWSNQGSEQLNDPLFDSAFNFFNKYAGQKNPAISTNAMCALKDAIDASDVNRFPENIYGTANRDTIRMKKVLAPFIPYGAKLEDPVTATLDDYSNLSATGINDVGWDLFPGNYDRYLHQINANTTSVGYWNVASRDTGSMYGRFARGFDLNNGKNVLYFDVDNAFLKNFPLNGKYPVMIEITYLDSGRGKFQFYYDAVSNKNKAAAAVTCTNSGLWKKTGITIYDAYFGNRGTNSSDFYIKNAGSQNVVFSVVELARPHADNADVGLFSSSSLDFDTVCLNSTRTRSFIISGLFLNGSVITIGPFKGFKFSTDSNGTYSDSIKIASYGASLKQPVYVQFNPKSAGSFSGNIIIKGGGVNSISVPVKAASVSNAALSAIVTNVSCYNVKDGSIDITAASATKPVVYNWISMDGYKDTAQDINQLKPSTYTVTVTSAGGSCTAAGTYMITQPEQLITSLSADAVICKGGTTNLYVTAMGGTTPYTGTGTFKVSSGKQTFTVTDAHGCFDKESISIPNGTLAKPNKPNSITSASDVTGLCGGGNFNFTASTVTDAAFYTWTVPASCILSGNQKNGSSITLLAPRNFNTGTLSVTAGNTCGSSDVQTKALDAVPHKPDKITGSTSAVAFQTGLQYRVPSVSGITYVWSVPGGAKIITGQNTANITVTWGSVAGAITVSANNSCGPSSSKTKLNVSLKGTLVSAGPQNVHIISKTEFSLQPNPVKNIAYLLLDAASNYNYTIQLFDIAGKQLLQRVVITQKGLNKVSLDVSALANGFYVLTIKNDKGELISMKLLKE